MKADDMSIQDQKWHWVKLKIVEAYIERYLATVNGFEPASVVYRNSEPYEVWMAGSSTTHPATDCEIGPEVEPMKVNP